MKLFKKLAAKNNSNTPNDTMRKMTGHSRNISTGDKVFPGKRSRTTSGGMEPTTTVRSYSAKVSQASMALQNQLSKDFWYLKHSRLLNSWKFRILLFVLLVSVGFTPGLLEVFYDILIGKSNLDSFKCDFYFHQYILAVMQFIILAMIAISFLKIRHPRFGDNFGIKRELQVTFIICTCIYVLYTMSLNVLKDKIFMLGPIQECLVILITSSYSAFFQVFRSYDNKYSQTNPENSNKKHSQEQLNVLENCETTGEATSDLKKLLSNDLGLEVFTEFAKRHFVLENILFYTEVEVYRREAREVFRMQGTSAYYFILEDAIRIFTVFLHASSPLEVNISFETAARIRQILNIVDESILSPGVDFGRMLSSTSSAKIESERPSLEEAKIENIQNTLYLKSSSTQIPPLYYYPSTTNTRLPTEDASKIAYEYSASSKYLPSIAITRGGSRNVSPLIAPEGLLVDFKESDLESVTNEEIELLIGAFDESQREILKLLAMDAFRTFRLSTSYAHLLRQMDSKPTAASI